MKKILILVNHHVVIYNLRKELVQKLLSEGYEVYISSPQGDGINKLKELGCRHIETKIDRRSINIYKDIKLIIFYIKIINLINPNCILAYTIKPNLYGSIASSIVKIPFMNTITGLGSAFAQDGVLQKILIRLYHYALKNSRCIFFQNQDNKDFFQRFNINAKKSKLVSGSGVNLEQHKYEKYPVDKVFRFLFVARVMKEKGIEEYVKAARAIRNKNADIEFHAIGFCEDGYQTKMQEWQEEGALIYHGMQSDVHSFMKKAHCIVHPSYSEGMCNVLLEAAACGRPIIASQIPGCYETFDESKSGYGFPVGNVSELIEKMQLFINLDHKEKELMGKNGRKKMEKEFDRQLVVESYMEEIKAINESIHN